MYQLPKHPAVLITTTDNLWNQNITEFVRFHISSSPLEFKWSSEIRYTVTLTLRVGSAMLMANVTVSGAANVNYWYWVTLNIKKLRGGYIRGRYARYWEREIPYCKMCSVGIEPRRQMKPHPHPFPGFPILSSFGSSFLSSTPCCFPFPTSQRLTQGLAYVYSVGEWVSEWIGRSKTGGDGNWSAVPPCLSSVKLRFLPSNMPFGFGEMRCCNGDLRCCNANSKCECIWLHAIFR